MVLYGVIELAGKLLKHTLGVLLLGWQRMLRFGLSVGVLSFVMVEVIGSALTRHFPPNILTTVVALIVSFALGYAAALTALADELCIGAAETIRLLEGDAKAGLRAAAVAAEREAGEARSGILRWLGHSPANAPESKPVRPAASATPPAPSVAGQPEVSEADETLEAIAATEDFQNTAPRARVNARPVRADQLPRIPWAYEQDGEAAVSASADTPPEPEGPELGSVPDMPPLPLRDAIAAADADVAPPSDGEDDDPAATLPSAPKPAAPAPALPTAAASDSITSDNSTVAETHENQGLPATDATTASDAPDAPDASDSGDRGIWSRIGQALVGNTMPLAALGGIHVAPAPDSARTSGGVSEDGDNHEPAQQSVPDDHTEPDARA